MSAAVTIYWLLLPLQKKIECVLQRHNFELNLVLSANETLKGADGQNRGFEMMMRPSAARTAAAFGKLSILSNINVGQVKRLLEHHFLFAATSQIKISVNTSVMQITPITSSLFTVKNGKR